VRDEKKKKRMLNEQELTELARTLITQGLIGDDISEIAVKRSLRLREVGDDIKRKLMQGKEFAPADFIRFFVLFFLFRLEQAGLLSFAYVDPLEWVVFNNAFSDYVNLLGDAFVFKNEWGRPQKGETTLLHFLGVFCQKHNLPNLYANSCDYVSLLTDALEVRLAKSKEWVSKKKGSIEWKKALLREFKAAKTVVARFWKGYYHETPPRLRKQDKACLIESLSIRDKSLIPFIPQMVSTLTSSTPK
jgi:hypothetical protein